MTIETSTITLPAYWASALINADQSGMSESEIACMNAYLDTALKGGWYVVSTEGEPYFSWHFGRHGGECDGGQLQDYVVHRQKTKTDIGS